MTREEATEFTRKLMAQAEINAFPNKPKLINNIPAFYFYTVLSALTGTPQPDPITRLMPCRWCGGKAGFHYSVMMRDDDCYVECGTCGEHSKVALSEGKARDAWNTAMGWKGGAE